MTALHVELGQRFGRLVVLGETRGAWSSGKPYRAARCRCDCGGEKVANLSSLLRGATRSCGCMPKVWQPGGPEVDPLYKVWVGMVQRCHNPRATSYGRYGARGVTVYGPWRESFARFKQDVELEFGPWPDGRHPSGKPLYTLDRADGTRGYAPGNVQWSTASEQQFNQGPRPGKTSKYPGVSYCSSTGRWLAQTYVNRKVRTVGRFDTEEAAHEAREAALAGTVSA